MDNSFQELSRRRRDTGSGISLELLGHTTLNFIFNKAVRKKLLGAFSGLDPYSENAEHITWAQDYGVAAKEDSDELIFLGASSSDKVRIINILKNEGGLAAISSIEKDSSELEDNKAKLTFETIISIIESTIVKLGPLIKICTINNYVSTDIDKFISDHTKKEQDRFPKKRMVAYYTKDTRQGKIIADSYYIGKGKTDTSESHPGMIKKRTLHAFMEEKDGPFSLADRYLNAYNNG